ncbi:MAG TPA: ABC transporter ATP-binding protein [Vicinamibacterales bacterium]|nr:ABC transporter ATP-binding protein [Vicinamibacterales bacterium]
MGRPIIEVKGISKKYRLGKFGATSFREELERWWENRRNKTPTKRKESNTDFWSLKDVSFDVQPGEVLGVIGKNGAGKSTLLKIISRITEPTEGQIVIDGRVASLLEVGTGFHPELTGRENIYLNGAILGMTRAEIARKFDAIVEFAEVTRFLDTPVKHYSSGMYVRLAFAVAAHLEPDVLIIDEVLAVGDADFQKKCMGKMEEVAGQEHRTILFVSHNMVAVKSMCHRAIWLENGRVREDGAADAIVTQYLKSSGAIAAVRSWPTFDAAPGGDLVRLRSVSVTPPADSGTDTLRMDRPIEIAIEVWNRRPGLDLAFTIHVTNEEQVVAFSSSSEDAPVWGHGPFPAGCFKTVCHVPANWLNSGVYRLTIFVAQDLSRELSQHRDIVSFEILDLKPRPQGYFMGKEPGVFFPALDWTTTRDEDAAP